MGDADDRKSQAGTLVQINGTPVHWRSFKQPIVAHSSTEAELIGLDLVARETIWFRRLLQDPRSIAPGPTVVHQDNQSTIRLATNPVYQQRTKHINVRYLAVRTWVTDQSLRLLYCPTDRMIADGFTKPLGKFKHREFTNQLGLVTPTSHNVSPTTTPNSSHPKRTDHSHLRSRGCFKDPSQSLYRVSFNA